MDALRGAKIGPHCRPACDSYYMPYYMSKSFAQIVLRRFKKQSYSDERSLDELETTRKDDKHESEGDNTQSFHNDTDVLQ